MTVLCTPLKIFQRHFKSALSPAQRHVHAGGGSRQHCVPATVGSHLKSLALLFTFQVLNLNKTQERCCQYCDVALLLQCLRDKLQIDARATCADCER